MSEAVLSVGVCTRCGRAWPERPGPKGQERRS